ncbi:hypothetical protein DCO48_01720 [Pseudomonas sp. SDI]|nr:hypothetical protein DCO48_01720 [Pseudomonas sp. SDI]
MQVGSCLLVSFLPSLIIGSSSIRYVASATTMEIRETKIRVNTGFIAYPDFLSAKVASPKRVSWFEMNGGK